jgi:hypothetical protein
MDVNSCLTFELVWRSRTGHASSYTQTTTAGGEPPGFAPARAFACAQPLAYFGSRDRMMISTLITNAFRKPFGGGAPPAVILRRPK